MDFVKNTLLITALLLPYPTYAASNLPTPEEVQGVINVCAAGRSVEAVGAFNLSYKKLFSGEIKGEGEGKLSDLGGIIATIEDDKLKVEVYGLYLTCVMPLLSDAKKESSTTTTIVDTKDGGNGQTITINGSVGKAANIKVNNGTITF